jgi:general secretion pathway protein G
MRSQRGTRASGFTLIEILIVVIILGILASVIIGLLGNTSRDAGGTALRDNLRTMRNALQVYVAQHGGYPSLADFESQMTQYTDADGNPSPTPTATHRYGPYILTMPRMPVGTQKGKTSVTSLTYTDGFGWQYDETSGAILANLPDVDVDADGVKFNTY